MALNHLLLFSMHTFHKLTETKLSKSPNFYQGYQKVSGGKQCDQKARFFVQNLVIYGKNYTTTKSAKLRAKYCLKLKKCHKISKF